MDSILSKGACPQPKRGATVVYEPVCLLISLTKVIWIADVHKDATKVVSMGNWFRHKSNEWMMLRRKDDHSIIRKSQMNR